MKKLLTAIAVLGMFMIPFAVYAQSDQQATQAPPVAPPLVREGDLAMKLVNALKMGTASTEADAETMLGSSGITPKNGWIADYPVTPDIIGELQNAVGAAADSKKLPMGKDEALKALQTVSEGFGLSVLPDTSGKYAENQPPTTPEYVQPPVINNYYYDEGPPVFTYYPPPWDYYYLYAWVPFPFWWGGFFFSGFFCLHDFHRVVIVNAHNVVVVSNHVINPISKTVVVVDPPARSSGKTVSTATNMSPKGGLNSTVAKNGASSIFNRSFQKATGGVTGKNSVSSMSSGTTGTQQIVTNRGGNTSTPNGNKGVSASPPTTSNKTVTTQAQTGHNEMGNRSLGSPQSSGRTSPAPSKSFSAPSTGSKGSFGGFHAGGGGHSFGHGGFSGGMSHGGGCRGRC